MTPDRFIAPPDPAAKAELGRASRARAELDAALAEDAALSDDGLVATVEAIRASRYREGRAPLIGLGFDWDGFEARLAALEDADFGFTRSLPIHVDVDGAPDPAAARRLLEALRDDLAHMRALAAAAYPKPEQIPARLECTVPDGTSNFELAGADAQSVFMIHLQDAGEFVHEELHHLERMVRAQGLWLFGNELTDDDLAPVRFGAMRSLRVLDLSENRLRQLPRSVTECEALEWLAVARNPSMDTLPPGLWRLTSLRRLDLRGTALDDATLARVRVALPGCDVLV